MKIDSEIVAERILAKLPQAVLGALEYRGFYDCGKYLDDTIFEFCKPMIMDEVYKALQQVKESESKEFIEYLERQGPPAI